MSEPMPNQDGKESWETKKSVPRATPHAERNYRWAASSQKRRLRFPVGDHNSILERNRDEYFAALRGFVKAVDQP